MLLVASLTITATLSSLIVWAVLYVVVTSVNDHNTKAFVFAAVGFLECVDESVRITTTIGLAGVSLKLIELHSVEQRGVALAFRTPGKFFLIKNGKIFMENRLLQLQ